jgi:hypothetical protein
MSTLHPTYTDDIFSLSIPVLAVDIVLFTLSQVATSGHMVGSRSQVVSSGEGRLSRRQQIVSSSEIPIYQASTRSNSIHSPLMVEMTVVM